MKGRSLARVLAKASVVVLLGLVGACSGTDIGGAGGAPACASCAYVYTNGGIACGPGPAIDAWHALANECACNANACLGMCKATFCQSLAADPTCSGCIATACPSTVKSCSMN